MAHIGPSYFNADGDTFATPEETTLSDLAVFLAGGARGKESHFSHQAKMLLSSRAALEGILSAHDLMLQHAQRFAGYQDLER